MSIKGTILVVDDEAAAVAAIAEMLHQDQGLRVLTAVNGEQAFAAARIHRPDLVLCDLRMPGMDGLALCRAVKSESVLDGILFVLVTDEPDARLQLDPSIGVDDVLVRPITPWELGNKVATLLRLKQRHDQLRSDKLEVERLHHSVTQRFDQLLTLLVHLVDLSVPGAAVRGAEIATLAGRLAERFDIPPILRGDLEVAARLHEIGKVVLDRETDGEGPEDVLEGDAWRYVVAAKELLEQTEGLGPAAELIGSIFENWDGTGHPDRLRQGQIPLRTRILRLLIDYQAQLARTGDPIAAFEALQPYAGTRYDPLAVAYFDAIIRASKEDDWQESRVRVPIASLEPGMVLADDLHTSSGVKLLAKGARLTDAQVDTILRRHRSDPIVHGAWIERRSDRISAGQRSI
jgi:putative two-component system response regulator